MSFILIFFIVFKVALYCANDARPKAAQLLKEAVTSATKQKSANPDGMYFSSGKNQVVRPFDNRWR